MSICEIEVSAADPC